MTTVCLIRHGETDANRDGIFQGRSDTPLNDRGREQASQSAGAVRHQRWDLVLTSPLRRAAETAGIVAAECGISDIRVVEAFVERDMGVATGRPYGEIDAAYPGGDIPGMEPLAAVSERVMRAFAEAVAEFQGRRMIVVAHAYVINAILYAVSNGAAGTNGIPRIKNGYVATITADGDGGWTIADYSSPLEH